MILSIGMIVKNEEKHLRACLTALQPILTGVDSELIIADTGSTDGTVDIAKEFTDHVLQVEWNDNFAEARNHTIRRARGEWYMFLDADEVFVETDDLIEFFNSGEYKDYGFAVHPIHNYLSNDYYEVSVGTRLFKKEKNTKFIGIIHEAIPFYFPRKDLKSYSNHTGYMFVNDPERRKLKHERNMSLLLKLYNRDPLDVRNISHIVNEYMVHGPREKAKYFLEVGYDSVKNKPNDSFYHYYHRRMVKFYIEMDTPEGRDLALEYGEQYLAKCEHMSVTAMDVNYYMGRAHHLSERYEAAVDAYIKCWELKQEYDAGTLDEQESLFDVIECLSDTFMVRIPFAIVLCYSQLNDYENVFEWCKQVDLKFNNIMDLYWGFMEVSRSFDKAGDLYRMITSLQGRDDALFNQLREKLEVNMTAHSEASAMFASFENYEPVDDFVRLQQLRHADEINADNFKERLHYFLQPERMQNAMEYVSLYSDILYITFKHNDDFFGIVEHLDVDMAIDLIAQMSVKRRKFPLVTVRFAMAQESVEHLSPKVSYWLFCLYTQALFVENGLSEEYQLLLFDQYVSVFYHYMQHLYNPKLLTDDQIDVLGGTFRFGYYMHKADKYKLAGDELNYMRNMKTALTHSGRFEKLVHLRIEEFKKEKQQKENERLNNKLRLDIMVRVLKSKIMKMIETGDIEEAEKLLMEYETINPADETIDKLRFMLNDKKGE